MVANDDDLQLGTREKIAHRLLQRRNRKNERLQVWQGRDPNTKVGNIELVRDVQVFQVAHVEEAGHLTR
jgi:hypothetical protein